MGKHWIIEHCTIVNARCVAIILGQAPGVDYDDIDAYGDHIVRIVTWKPALDLSTHADKPVRLRFEMSDADLYSLRFR